MRAVRHYHLPQVRTVVDRWTIPGINHRRKTTSAVATMCATDPRRTTTTTDWIMTTPCGVITIRRGGEARGRCYVFVLFSFVGVGIFFVLLLLAFLLWFFCGCLGWAGIYFLFCCVIGSFLLLYPCFALCLCLRKFSLVVCYVEQQRRESERRQMLADLSDFSSPPRSPRSPVPPLETPDGSGGYRTMGARSSEGVWRPRHKRRRTGRMVRRGY